MRFDITPLAHFINVATKLKGCKIATLSCWITGSGDRFDKYLNGTIPHHHTLNKIKIWADENNVPFCVKSCYIFE